MKFSSISLIAVALTAIASGAVAAPGPLYARALADVDNLFRRRPVEKKFHQNMSKEFDKLAEDHYVVAKVAEGMGGRQTESWKGKAKKHYERSVDCDVLSLLHHEESMLETQTSLKNHADAHHKLIEEDTRAINRRIQNFMKTGQSRYEKQVADNPQLEPTRW